MNLAETLLDFSKIYYQKNPQKAPVFFSPFMSEICKNHEVGGRPPPPALDYQSDNSGSVTVLDLVRMPITKSAIEDLLGYRINYLNYFRLFTAITFIGRRVNIGDSNTLNVTNFLKSAKIVRPDF